LEKRYSQGRTRFTVSSQQTYERAIDIMAEFLII